ncbi:LysR family transcriptional regulator [Sphingomonas glacialis]|uniref:LysR family transcriptional regulator n=1 Tax=Sphingomonas glacialis TaxID=658225 RepID=UPI00112978BB|nr:LysR family transcriptional regulator [Sphingomonas glacialis]
MDLRQLRRFITVAELGSFNRAAELLAVSQPSLTRSIQLLEDSLDSRLFDRGARGVTLTTLGEQLLPHARIILSERDRALSAISALRGRSGGLVTVGADSSFAMRQLPAALGYMVERHPDIQIVVKEENFADMLDSVREGRLNLALGLRASYLPMGDLLFEQLKIESAGVMIRAGHPVLRRSAPPRLADLAAVPWIVTDQPLVVEGWSKMFLDDGVPVPSIALRTSSLQVTKACILSGNFVALGNHTSYSDEIDAGLVHALDLGYPRYERPAGLFRRAGGKLSPAERAFIAILHEVCGELDAA